MAFIFWASSLLPEEVDQSLQPLAVLGALRSILGHLVMYAILAALIHLSIWCWRPESRGSLRWGMAALVLAVLYGISDEFQQSLGPGREPSTLDVLVAGAGALMGIVAVKYPAASLTQWVKLAGRPLRRSEAGE
jgi:VanZ family protein